MERSRQFFIVCAMAIPMAILSADCRADVKDSIFRDCSSTLDTFAKLPPDKQTELISFFGEVLKLKIQPLPQALPVLPHTDTDLASIWLGFSADREHDAKLCALKLLREAGSRSVLALPDILHLTADPMNSDEMIEQLDAAAYAIADASAVSINQEQLNEIIPFATERLQILGDNILGLLPARMVQRAVIAHAISLNAERQAEVIDFLSWLDPSGLQLQEVAFEILNEVSTNESRLFITKLLGIISCPNPRTARYLRDMTAAIDLDVSVAGINSLDRIIHNLLQEPQCPINSGTISGSDLLAILLEEVRFPEAWEAKRLGLIAPLLRGRSNSRALPVIRTALESTAPTPSSEADPAVTALVSLGIQSRDLILEAMKSKNTVAKRRAAFALEELQLQDAKKLKPFVPYLTDSDTLVRKHIYRSIAPVAKELRTDIRKLLDQRNDKDTEFALLALAWSGESSSTFDADFTRAMQKLPCDTMQDAIAALGEEKSLASKALREKGKSCLLKESIEACKALAWVAVSKPLQDELTPTIVEHFHPTDSLCILNSYQSIALREKLGLKMQSLLSIVRSDPALRERALLLAAADTKDPAAYNGLREIVLAGDLDISIRRDALKTLGEMRPPVAFWKEFLRTLAELEQSQLFYTIGCINSPEILQAAEEILVEASPLQRPSFIRFVGLLGSKASALENKLREFISSKHLNTRYEAVVALLRISDSTHVLVPNVAALLKTRFARKFSKEILPPDASAVLLSLPKEASPFHARLHEALKVAGNRYRKLSNLYCSAV